MSENKILYLDCASGISGDMTVAALLDLGANEKGLLEMLHSLPLTGWDVQISRVKKSGIDACDFKVILDPEHENHDHDMAYLHGQEYHEHKHEHDHDHPHDHDHHHEHHHHHGRNLEDITEILRASSLSPSALQLALRIFEIVAKAEAHVHGLPIDQVHFHEVGAVDSILDIAAAAYCLDDLHVQEVVIPSLTEGTGQIRCQHGLLPIPVPATAAIAAQHSLPLHITSVTGELVTPTGAAIAAAICTGHALPETFTIDRIGTGAGKREYAVAGILRAMLLTDRPSGDDELHDRIIQLETNMDDCSGETLGFLMDELLQAGALDVFYIPVTAKKNRPGVLLTVLCREADREELESLIFRHATSIGIRRSAMERTKLERQIRTFDTPWGSAAVKYCRYQDEIYCYPEHESVAALAHASGLGYKEIYNAIKSFAVRKIEL